MKDYKKKKGTRAPVKRRKPQSKSNNKLAGGLSLLFIVVSIAIFIAIAMQLNSRDKAEPMEEEAAPTPKVAKSTLPPPPPSKFSYQDTLGNKTVDVEVEDKSQLDRYEFTLRCASFRNQQDAEAMKARIAFNGLTADVRRTTGSNGVWYRVQFGPFSKKRDAEKLNHKMQSMKINGCKIYPKKLTN